MPRRDRKRTRAYERERSRREADQRRAEGRCTDCGEPSQGAARCEPCARRSWERSAYFGAMPVFDPQFTVVDLETGDEHGPYDSWEDVALALAFARLPPDRVEVITDAPAIAGAEHGSTVLEFVSAVMASRSGGGEVWEPEYGEIDPRRESI